MAASTKSWRIGFTGNFQKSVWLACALICLGITVAFLTIDQCNDMKDRLVHGLRRNLPQSVASHRYTKSIFNQLMADSLSYHNIILHTDLESPVYTNQKRFFRAQLAGWDDLPLLKENQADQREPKLVAALHDKEIMTLADPVTVSWGLYEFEYTFLTPGLHEIEVFFESDCRWTNTSEKDWIGPQYELHTRWGLNKKAGKFHVQVIESSFDSLKTHLASLPMCSRQDLLDPKFDGRYVDNALLSQSDDTPVGIKENLLTFVPETCQLRQFTTADAQKCLKDKRIIALGDSTLEELTADIVLLLHGTDRLPFLKSSAGSSSNCSHERYHLRMYSWNVPDVDAQIDNVWTGATNICENGEGVTIGWSKDAFRDRFELSLRDSTTIRHFPLETDTAYQIPLASQEARQADIVLLNSGLHDIESAKWRRVEHLPTYRIHLEEAVQVALRYSKRVVMTQSNPSIGLQNVVTHKYNQVLEEVARKYGIDVIPTFNIQKSRIRKNGDAYFEDRHHSSSIVLDNLSTTFLRTNTQALLNVLC